jgi:hypothetical protein
MSITVTQAKNLRRGTILYHKMNRNADGTPQRWRVTGKPKTWNRTPGRVEVPVRQGLYHNDTLTEKELFLLSLTEDEAKGVVKPKTNTPALSYLKKLVNAVEVNKIDTSPYRGKEGAKRLAKDFGYGLNDFPRSQHKDAINASYTELKVPIYGTGLLTKKEWTDAVKSRISKYGGQS